LRDEFWDPKSVYQTKHAVIFNYAEHGNVNAVGFPTPRASRVQVKGILCSI